MSSPATLCYTCLAHDTGEEIDGLPVCDCPRPRRLVYLTRSESGCDRYTGKVTVDSCMEFDVIHAGIVLADDAIRVEADDGTSRVTACLRALASLDAGAWNFDVYREAADEVRDAARSHLAECLREAEADEDDPDRHLRRMNPRTGEMRW